jgi:hypothetical protein
VPPGGGHGIFQEAIRKGKSKKIGQKLAPGPLCPPTTSIQSPSLEPEASEWEDRVHLAEL